MRAVWLLFAAFTLGACSAPPAAARRAKVPRAVPSETKVFWPRFAEVSNLPAVGEPFPNDGHPRAGARATVRVSPDARRDYEHLVGDRSMPEGTLVAIFHDAGASSAAGPVYVMEKTAGTWRYLSLGADGSIDRSPGTAQQLSLGACAGCHQGGLGDSLFGLPRP